jgi:NADH:ubiquinone oxidoreductase subunit 4 (subunit M)
MIEYPSILLSLITLPLLGILVIMVLPQNQINLVKTVSLTTSLIIFIISILLWLNFDLSTPKYQFVEHFFSLPYSNINVFI